MQTILLVGIIGMGALAYGLHLASAGKRLSVRILFFALLAPYVFLWVNLWAGDRRTSAYKHLEENAKNAVTAAELQNWATNVLAHPGDYTLQTNYPNKLRNIRWVENPDISICTNVDPAYVTIDWSPRDAVAKFEIGSTNFAGPGHKWQDGVYFRSE